MSRNIFQCKIKYRNWQIKQNPLWNAARILFTNYLPMGNITDKIAFKIRSYKEHQNCNFVPEAVRQNSLNFSSSPSAHAVSKFITLLILLLLNWYCELSTNWTFYKTSRRLNECDTKAQCEMWVNNKLIFTSLFLCNKQIPREWDEQEETENFLISMEQKCCRCRVFQTFFLALCFTLFFNDCVWLAWGRTARSLCNKKMFLFGIN